MRACVRTIHLVKKHRKANSRTVSTIESHAPTVMNIAIHIDKILNVVSCDRAIELVTQRARERSDAREIVAKLPPGVPQRTPEWYRVRRGMITASEFKIAGAANPCDSYVWGKIFPQPFPSNAAMQWGCRFEDLAAATYEYENSCTIKEFGLLVHPRVDWLGASPDGITEYGVAIEIKVPFSRKRVEIDKRVAESRPFPKTDRATLYARYAPQVQGQLEVCDLEVCDFVVAHIDALDRDTFWQMRRVSEQGYRYAIVADHHDAHKQKNFYATSPLDADESRLRSWIDSETARATYSQSHHVHVRELGVTRIRRDRDCWREMQKNLQKTKSMIEDIKRGARQEPSSVDCRDTPMFSVDSNDDLDDIAVEETPATREKRYSATVTDKSGSARPLFRDFE